MEATFPALLLLVASSSISLPSWSLARLDPVSTRTIVRAWHEVYSSRGTAHDFPGALAPPSPPRPRIGIGAVLHGEVRAIAVCSEEKGDGGALVVQCVCHPPGAEAAAYGMVMMLTGEYAVDWSEIRKQPRWYVAFSFLSEAS